MISFNYLVSMAVAVLGAAPGILAETLVEAAAKANIVTYDAPTKHSVGVKRTNTGGVDPYSGWNCAPWYRLEPIPANPQCHQNNCYRSFLSARKGSSGFHCPSVALDYCCQWSSLTAAEREYVVSSGILFHFLPWTDICGAAGPFDTPADVQTVVSKVDDACACTLNHQVRVTLPNEYAVLTPGPVSDPVCRQNL